MPGVRYGPGSTTGGQIDNTDLFEIVGPPWASSAERGVGAGSDRPHLRLPLPDTEGTPLKLTRTHITVIALAVVAFVAALGLGRTVLGGDPSPPDTAAAAVTSFAGLSPRPASRTCRA